MVNLAELENFGNAYLESHRHSHSLTVVIGEHHVVSMERNKHSQRGATFLGMLVIVAILGAALYAGIRLTPIYLEYFAIVRAMDQIAKTEDGSSPVLQSWQIAGQSLDH